MAVLNHTACNKQFGTISVSHNINSHSSGAHFRLLIAARSERECEREGEWWMRPLSCRPMTPGMLTCTCLPPTSPSFWSIYKTRKEGGCDRREIDVARSGSFIGVVVVVSSWVKGGKYCAKWPIPAEKYRVPQNAFFPKFPGMTAEIIYCSAVGPLFYYIRLSRVLKVLPLRKGSCQEDNIH